MQRNFRGIKFFGMLTLICGIILICLYDSGKFPSWGTNIPIPNSNGNYCDVLIEESHENIENENEDLKNKVKSLEQSNAKLVSRNKVLEL